MKAIKLSGAMNTLKGVHPGLATDLCYLEEDIEEMRRIALNDTDTIIYSHDIEVVTYCGFRDDEDLAEQLEATLNKTKFEGLKPSNLIKDNSTGFEAIEVGCDRGAIGFVGRFFLVCYVDTQRRVSIDDD